LVDVQSRQTVKLKGPPTKVSDTEYTAIVDVVSGSSNTPVPSSALWPAPEASGAGRK
jgi:hypothetical protein